MVAKGRIGTLASKLELPTEICWVFSSLSNFVNPSATVASAASELRYSERFESNFEQPNSASYSVKWNWLNELADAHLFFGFHHHVKSFNLNGSPNGLHSFDDVEGTLFTEQTVERQRI